MNINNHRVLQNTMMMPHVLQPISAALNKCEL